MVVLWEAARPGGGSCIRLGVDTGAGGAGSCTGGGVGSVAAVRWGCLPSNLLFWCAIIPVLGLVMSTKTDSNVLVVYQQPSAQSALNGVPET
jgi:hypothetical protein